MMLSASIASDISMVCSGRKKMMEGNTAWGDHIQYCSSVDSDNQPDSITIHTSYTIWNLCVKIESQTAALLQAYPPSSTAVDGNGFCYRSYCKTLGPFYQYPQSVSSTDASPCLCLSLCLTLSLSLSLTVCVKQ